MKGGISRYAPTWYNLPWSEKIVMCLSYPALPKTENVIRSLLLMVLESWNTNLTWWSR